MPIIHSRDEVKRRITVVAIGAITLDDVLAFIEAQHAEGAWSDSVLIDARAITTWMTADETRAIAERAASLSRQESRGPVAMVATDPVVFGMNRMYGSLSDNLNQTVRVFRELLEAEEWLQAVTRDG